MKLLDALKAAKVENIKDPRWDYYPPVEEICDALNVPALYSHPDLHGRLLAFPIYKWLCTDEHVGLSALYLDGVPVGALYRNGRKWPYNISFISNEAADDVRSFLFMILIESEGSDVNLIDPELDIGERFTVEYATEALTDYGYYEGRPVKALVFYSFMHPTTPKEHRREGRAYYQKHEGLGDLVLVQDGDRQHKIPMKDFEMDFAFRERQSS